MRRFKWKEYKQGLVPNPFSFRWDKRFGRLGIMVCSPWDEEWIGTIRIGTCSWGFHRGIEIDLYFISICIDIWTGE